jgi:hypothetical protein
VSYQEQVSTDSATKYSLVNISVGDLVDLNIASGDHPLVYFDVDGEDNEVKLDLTIGGLVDVGVLTDYVLIFETKQGDSGFD